MVLKLSRLIVRFIFLLIKTENTDTFSEKKKKKCCIIKKDLSVVHEKFASINQKHYQDLGSVASSKWNFSAPFPSQTSFRGENIDCFLRIFHKSMRLQFQERDKSVNGRIDI